MGILKTRREFIAQNYGEDLIVFENPSFDSAIVGVTHDDRVIYDYDKMIESLMADESFKDKDGTLLSYDDAVDWIEFNTLRSIPYAGDRAPVVMYNLEDVFDDEDESDGDNSVQQD